MRHMYLILYILFEGIGRFLSMELARHGATVVCWSKSAGPNEEVVRQIIRDGGSAYAYTVDVADRNVVHYTAQLVGSHTYLF